MSEATEDGDMGPYLVHMEGPDDLEYFGTWPEACKYAQDFNLNVLAYNERTQHPGMVRSWAIPYEAKDFEERWAKILAKPAQVVPQPNREALARSIRHWTPALVRKYESAAYEYMVAMAAALSPAPLTIDREALCDAIEDNLQNLETSWRGIDENSSERWLDEQPLGLVVGMAADAVIAFLKGQES